MSWKRRNESRKRSNKRKNYSIANKLEKEGKIDDKFKIMLNSLPLEDIIALKLELAATASGASLFGIPIWYALPDITKDACLRFAISATKTKIEAANFLGLNIFEFERVYRLYQPRAYFKDEPKAEPVEPLRRY